MNIVNNIVNHAMFPGTQSSYDGASFEELIWIPLDDTSAIPAILLPYLIGSDYVIIYAHGNGTDLGDIIGRLESLSIAVRAHVIAFDYPGYGCFKGTADMELIDKVMVTVVNFVKEQLRWPLENIVLYGCSIGTGPCTRFAKNIANENNEKTLLDNESCPSSHIMSPVQTHRLGGLILQCPYRSIRHAAEKFIGGFMSRLFIESFWNIEEEVQQCCCPILWIHGKKDELFDWKGSEAMYEKYMNSKKLLKTPETATHLVFNFDQDIVFPIKHFLNTMVSEISRPLPFFSMFLNLNADRLKPPPISCPIPLCPPSFSTKIYDILFKTPFTESKQSTIDSEIRKSKVFQYFQKYSIKSISQDTLEYHPDSLFLGFLPDTSGVPTNKLSQSVTLQKLFQKKSVQLASYVPITVSNNTLSSHRIPPAILPSTSMNESFHIRCDKSYEIQKTNTRLIKSASLQQRYISSLFKHVWPIESLRFYIQSSFFSIAYTLLRETLHRNLSTLHLEPLFKVIEWVRRFYSIRCRHFMGVDLVYKKAKTVEGSSIFHIYGVSVAGRLIRLNSISQIRGCINVSILQLPLGYHLNRALDKEIPESIYLNPDFLVFPIYSTKADFIFCLSCWLITFLESINQEKFDYDTFHHKEFWDILIKNPNYFKTLETLSETYLNDFCTQSRRPYIEKLMYRLGNYVCFGWDQLLGILFNQNWVWFRSRLCLALPSSKTRLFCDNDNNTYNRSEEMTHHEVPSKREWINVQGWNMFRSWYRKNKLSYGIYLNTLLVPNRNEIILKAPVISSSLQKSVSSTDASLTRQGFKKLMGKAGCNQTQAIYTSTTSFCFIGPLQKKDATHDAAKISENIKQELLGWLIHLAQSLKEAMVHFVPFRDLDLTTLGNNPAEANLRKKYSYFNLLYSLENIAKKNPAPDNVFCNVSRDTTGWERQMGAFFFYDPDIFCSPTLQLLNDSAWLDSAKEWIKFLLPATASDINADPIDVQNLIKQDRLLYMRRCLEFDNINKTKSLRYSICYHHLFHYVLTQPGRYFTSDLYYAIDSFWRLVEVMTRIECGPKLNSDRDSSEEISNNFTPNQTFYSDGPSSESAAIMFNVTIALMVLRRLYIFTIQYSRSNAASPVFDEAASFSSFSDKFPGVSNPQIRLFDELRFMLLKSTQKNNYVVKGPIIRHGGYPHYTMGWESGCYEATQSCFLAAQLENLYSFFIEILEAIDLDNASPAVASLRLKHYFSSDGHNVVTHSSPPEHTNALCYYSSQKLSKTEKAWWLDNFDWTTSFPLLSHLSNEQSKTAITSDISTVASSKTDLFESPIINIQSTGKLTCLHTGSSSPSISVESSNIQPDSQNNPRKFTNQWLTMLSSLKAKRKSRFSRLKKSVRHLIA